MNKIEKTNPFNIYNRTVHKRGCTNVRLFKCLLLADLDLLLYAHMKKVIYAARALDDEIHFFR